jgi:hypothetical protein
MRIRLKAPFFFQNHLYQPGEIVELPEGVEGPHRSKTVSHDKIDYGTNPSIDANRILGDIALEPLFDVVEEEGESKDKPKPMLAIAPPVKS